MDVGLSFIFFSKNDFDRMLPEILKDIPEKITRVDYHDEDMSVEFYFNNEQERKKYVEKEQNLLLYYLYERPIPITFEPEDRFLFGFVPEQFYFILKKTYLL